MKKIESTNEVAKTGMTSKEKFLAISFWALILIFCEPAREVIFNVLKMLFEFFKMYILIILGVAVGIVIFCIAACIIGALCQVIYKVIKGKA